MYHSDWPVPLCNSTSRLCILVMVTIDVLQQFYLILRKRKDVLMTPFLNPKKFQFCQKSVDFAGFWISDERIEPLPKYLDSIHNFQTPKSVTDIRSWFGLIIQVSCYAKIHKTMAVVRDFPSPKCKFMLTKKLNYAFKKSKEIIEIIDIEVVFKFFILGNWLVFDQTGQSKVWVLLSYAETLRM